MDTKKTVILVNGDEHKFDNIEIDRYIPNMWKCSCDTLQGTEFTLIPFDQVKLIRYYSPVMSQQKA